MARDFDFRKQPVKRYQPVQRNSVATPRPKRSKLWIILLVIIGLILVSVAVYMQYRQTTPTTASSQATVNKAADNTQPTNAEIKVYDGGAGEAASKELVEKLIAKDLDAVYLGKSLDQYSGTQIWFSANYKELAETVAGIVAKPTTTQHQAQVSGNYNILIFVGS